MALFVEEVLVIVGVTVLCGDVEDMVWLRTEGVLLGEMLVRGGDEGVSGWCWGGVSSGVLTEEACWADSVTDCDIIMGGMPWLFSISFIMKM